MATAPLSNLTALWNSAGTAFNALKMNVTDTASAAGSLLIDLQVGGVSQFKVSKAGVLTGVLTNCTGLPNASVIGLGTAALVNTGTSGAAIPLLNAANTFGANQGITQSSSGNHAVWNFTNSAGATGHIGMDRGGSGNRVMIGYGAAADNGGAIQIDATNNTLFLTGVIGTGATGGHQGAGTSNWTAVYDDGVVLTCYVLEAWLTGGIDVVFWDTLVPDRNIPAVTVEQEPGNFVEVEPARIEERRHERARGFASVAADRLDIDKFAQFMRTNKRLPAFPGPEHWQTLFSGKMPTGDLLQRLWETCEVLAVHLAQARERELALETRISVLENRT